MRLSEAQATIAAWAHFKNAGAVHRLGPDDYSKPMQLPGQDHDIEGYREWSLVEACLTKVKADAATVEVLTSVYWHGKQVRKPWHPKIKRLFRLLMQHPACCDTGSNKTHRAEGRARV